MNRKSNHWRYRWQSEHKKEPKICSLRMHISGSMLKISGERSAKSTVSKRSVHQCSRLQNCSTGESAIPLTSFRRRCTHSRISVEGASLSNLKALRLQSEHLSRAISMLRHSLQRSITTYLASDTRNLNPEGSENSTSLVSKTSGLTLCSQMRKLLLSGMISLTGWEWEMLNSTSQA